MNFLVDKTFQPGECTANELNKFVRGDVEYNQKYLYGYKLQKGKKRFFYDRNRGFEANNRLIPKRCLYCDESISTSLYRCNDCDVDGFLKEKEG